MDDFDLLVLGDCNPDLVLSGADVRPRFGQQERLVDEGRLTIGGSGAILACAAARLGLRTALAAVVGDDVLGHWMLDQLAGRGVEVGGCVVDPVRPTGLTVVLSEPGDRAILTAVGTIAALRVEDVDPDRRRAARHLHVSSYYLQTALRPGLGRLFRQARRIRDSTRSCRTPIACSPTPRRPCGSPLRRRRRRGRSTLPARWPRAGPGPRAGPWPTGP